jgi:murein DD-endopeptidase MepM/ murein hydrolase activator NlpD
LTKFIYNPKTCRYEREGINLLRIGGLLALVLTLSFLFFAGIATLHGLVWQSDEEIRLRSENKALKQHYAVVKQQFEESEQQLSALEEKDKALKVSLFNSIFTEPEKKEIQHASFIMVTDVNTLRDRIEELKEITKEIASDAVFNSAYFGDKLAGNPKKIIDKLSVTPSIMPVVNGKLISGFGKRIHPFHKGLYNHPGIDITATRGTEVVASADGYVSEVTKSELLAGYGNTIELSHSQTLSTRYAHLEAILVRQGQKVKKGQVIGTVGNSGGSIAPHLHYEVLRNGREQNPIYYFLQNIDPAQYQQLYAISLKQNQSLD